MSSFKGGFSKAELDLLKAWEVPDVVSKPLEEQHEETAEEAVETKNKDEQKPKILTVEEIETMQDQAYLEAFEQGEKKGYEAGYDKGYAEGSSKGFEENKQLLQQQAELFKQLMSAFSDPFQELDKQVEQELLTLAMGVAKQIIRREIKTDPGQVIAAVREAIAVLPVSSRKISLHLHPEDANLVRSALALDEMSHTWEVIEEPNISRGGCKIETETSRIDASVENRLTQVIANVLGDQREQESDVND